MATASSQTKPLRIALIGCGQIADAHLQEINKISSATVVGVCDRMKDLAEQAAMRFNVPYFCDDLQTLLSETKPDVVHIATPAHTHGPLAIELLEAGCHVYVEKPFTLDAAEARTVIETAQRVGKQVCIGHDQLFDPMWLRTKKLIESKAIGNVVHIESVLGYPLSGQFGAQVTSDPNHWVRKLPGGLFQNTISHPLYRVTDLLTEEHVEIEAHWFSRNAQLNFPSELRAHLRGESVTGSVTFLTGIQPCQRVTRVYGSAGELEVDFDSQVIRIRRAKSLPGAFAKLHLPFCQWKEATGNLWRNMMRFVRSDIHYFAGMNELFRQFYQSIQKQTPPPIAPEEIVRVTQIMDHIFASCQQSSNAPVAETPVLQSENASQQNLVEVSR